MSRKIILVTKKRQLVRLTSPVHPARVAKMTGARSTKTSTGSGCLWYLIWISGIIPFMVFSWICEVWEESRVKKKNETYIGLLF